MSRKAMQVALEALEDANDVARMEFSDENYYSEAISALRQALVDADDTSQKRVDEMVKTEQEPVAEIQAEDMGKPFNAIRVTVHFYAEVPAVGTKLYKAPPKRDLTCVCGAVWEGEMMVHPPRKREWVGLADEKKIELWNKHENHWRFEDNLMAFTRDIEAKLKEKNT